MSKDLQELNDILFKQLEILTEIKVSDENFEKERLRAETVFNVADRVIKNAELSLRNEVWQSTKKFKLATRNNYIKIGTHSEEDYD